MDTFRFVLVLSNFGLCLAVNNLVATPLIQSFYSHPGFGSTNYPAGNYTQDWHITTNWVNHTIKLNIKTCHIESPKGVCTFDFLYIYDGADSNSTQMMKSCCGTITPHPGNSWESTFGEIYLLFVTDDLVTDQGFEIEYWSNGITTTTSTTTPAPTTESTTAMQTNSESTQANPTQTVSAKAETADNTLYIIIACSVTGLLVLVVVILIIVVCIKKNKPVTPQPFLVQNEKSMQMKNGKNNPVLSGPPPTPPIGTMMTNAETNLFDLELPEKARGNLLPPLYSSKVVNNPSG